MIPVIPVTRTEMYLAKLCGADIKIPAPITRSDFYYAKLCGMDVTIPMPITRTDIYLAKLCGMDVIIPHPVTRLDVYMSSACGMVLDIDTPEPITRIETYWRELAVIFNVIDDELNGSLPLTFESNGADLIDYRIYGNSIQDGVPSPQQPIEVKSVGDKTKNLFNMYAYAKSVGGETVNGLSKFMNNKGDQNFWLNTSNITGSLSCSYILSDDTILNRSFYLIVHYDDGTQDNQYTWTNSATGFITQTGKNVAGIELSYGHSGMVEIKSFMLSIVENLLPDISEENGWTDGYLNGGGGRSSQDPVRLEMVSPYIKIEPDKPYTFSTDVNTDISNQWTAMCFYDNDYKFIGTRIADTGKSLQIATSPSNARYCRVSLRTYGSVNYVALENREIATDYVPYGYHIPIEVSDGANTTTTNIYLDEPLRRVGEYYDYIDYENQCVVRRISTHIYTGDEDFSVVTLDAPRAAVVFKLPDSLITTPSTLISNTHFEVSAASQINDLDYITNNREAHSGANRYYIPPSFFSELTEDTVISEWKEYIRSFYISGNPVIVYYVLKEPVIENISLPDIPTFTGTNTLDINTTVKPYDVYLQYRRKINIETPAFRDIQALVRNGYIKNLFKIRDRLSCTKSEDTLTWDIIGIDHDMPADSQYSKSMTLQLHDCWKNRMQFDAPEAFYYCETALPAGTYHFMVDKAYEPSYNDYSAYQFTLANGVPAGGQLTFDWAPNTSSSAAKISSFSSALSTVQIETVEVIEGTDGVEIGTLTESGDFKNNLNSICRVRYGSNNYKESAIRQWLNSDKPAGSVWTPQTKFDRPPSWLNTADGFMYGMEPDFLAAVGKTHIIAARNEVCDGGGCDEMEDYFFILSRNEVYAGNDSNQVIEGKPYPYYSDYSELSAAGTEPDSNRIKYWHDGLIMQWWNRTPVANDSRRVYQVSAAGDTANPSASSIAGVAPACNII